MRSELARRMAQFDALSTRERALVMLAVLTGTLALWYVTLLAPALAERERAIEERVAVQERIDVAEQAMAARMQRFPGRGSGDEARLETLRARARTVEESLDALVAELIAPVEMPRVLEQVLDRQRHLELERMSNLGAEPLLEGDAEADETLYEHGLELTLRGSYLACLAYLQDLEALPWRFYWRLIEIDAEDYPKTRIRIEVSTLSLEKDWIGV